MPAVPVLAMLALCVTLTAQASSSHAAAEPAVLRLSSPAEFAAPVAPALSVAASFGPENAAAVHADRPVAADEPSGQAALGKGPEARLPRGFSFAEAGLLLLVGSCMVWVGFAKRRNHPPRRVIR